MTVIDLSNLSVGMLAGGGDEESIQIRDLVNGRIYLPNGDLYENNPCYTLIRNKKKLEVYVSLEDSIIHLVPKNENIIMG